MYRDIYDPKASTCTVKIQTHKMDIHFAYRRNLKTRIHLHDVKLLGGRGVVLGLEKLLKLFLMGCAI